MQMNYKRKMSRIQVLEIEVILENNDLSIKGSIDQNEEEKWG